jgi:hypothetical protein
VDPTEFDENQNELNICKRMHRKPASSSTHQKYFLQQNAQWDLCPKALGKLQQLCRHPKVCRRSRHHSTNAHVQLVELFKKLSIFDRFLTPAILLAMIIGVIIGEFVPNVQHAFDTIRFDSVSVREWNFSQSIIALN